MDKIKKITDLKMAVQVFEIASHKQAEATEQGNYKEGNKHYSRIMRAIKFLKKKDSIDTILPLLNKPSIGVRLWTASYLLPKYEKESIAILSEITKNQDIHSLTAETILNEWKTGNLKI